MHHDVALEIQRLGNQSRRSAVVGGVGLAILVGSLILSAIYLAVARQALSDTRMQVSLVQADLKSSKGALDSLNRQLTDAKAQLEERELRIVSAERRASSARQLVESLLEQASELETRVRELRASTTVAPTARKSQVDKAWSRVERSVTSIQASSQQLERTAFPTPPALDRGAKDPVPKDPVPQDPVPKDLVPQDPVPKDLVPQDPVPKDLAPQDPARKGDGPPGSSKLKGQMPAADAGQ